MSTLDTLFATLLVPAKAHEYVTVHELRGKAAELGINVNTKDLQNAGYPTYRGKAGQSVVMGVQFK